MAEGWRQAIEDLRGALGLPTPRVKPNGAEPIVGSAPPKEIEPTPDRTPPPARDDGAHPEPAADASREPAPAQAVEPVAAPLTWRQKVNASVGLAATFLLAVGIGWYVYFGGPRPPAPDVVATFEGGQITVQQVRDHIALIAPGLEAMFASYENYRAMAGHMVLNELVRRWAAEQQLDTDAKFSDAMRHISESVTLDQWVAELHKNEMTSAVSESEVQAYYQANQTLFGDATLSEVRERIRETLAHENQQAFFRGYIADLRAEATITLDDGLLAVPAPADTQIREYYEANRPQFALPQRAVVDMISVPIVGEGEKAEAEARARAEAARAALNAGRDFAEVAAEYSQTPSSETGLTLEAGMDNPALAEQAFALLEAGDLSPVFRAQSSYYLLRLREQQPARSLSLDEVRPQIVAALRAENEKAWFEQNADRTLFTIHGERYTLGQFYHEYENLPPELRAQYAGPDGMRELADRLIDRLLVLEDAYNRLLDQENTPLLEEARSSVLAQMLHAAEVDTKVAVSDQQVRDYYEQHQELFAAPPEARIQQIRIDLGQSGADRKQAWERAEAAYRKLVPGLGAQPADFEAVAREYDESEKDSGEVGLGEWVRMGDDLLQGLPAHLLHQYLLNLSVGSISRPFEVGDSLYIVKVLERVEPEPLGFEQVKDYIQAELEAQQHEQLDAELAGRLLREARFMVYDRVILEMVEADVARPATETP